MRDRLLAILLATAAALLASTAAEAQLAGDVVVLKNGGMLRGTVVAIEPGKEVSVIVLGSSQARTLQWSEVERVDRAQAQVQAPAPAPLLAPLPPAPAPVQPALGAPLLHVRSESPNVTLYEDDGLTTRPICATPCDRVVDGRVGQSFYFGGEGISGSPRFQLATLSGRVEARVSAGSSGSMGGGIVAVIVGGIGVLVGVPFALIGATHDAGSGSSGFAAGGGVTAGFGGIVLGAGILSILVSGRTKVEIVPSGQAIRPALTARGLELRF